MTKAINNYDKTKISMAHVFLQYDQATMIHKYSLDYNSDWLYITFINRTYRINRKTGSVQWSDNDFETVHEANHNEAMTIYDVLCYSKDRCHAVMGMETALSKPAVASVFMEGLKKFEQIFQEVLLCSGLSPDHAKILSQRMLSIYQGYFLLGRISADTSYLKNAKKNMIEMYREYRAFHGI